MIETELGELVTEQEWVSVREWVSVEETLSLSPRQAQTAKSILDRIGWKKLCFIIWHSTPFPLRVISFFYGLAVYRNLLASSKCLDDLRLLHMDRYRSSRSFRLLRPRYHRVVKLLYSLGMAERVAVD